MFKTLSDDFGSFWTDQGGTHLGKLLQFPLIPKGRVFNDASSVATVGVGDNAIEVSEERLVSEPHLLDTKDLWVPRNCRQHVLVYAQLAKRLNLSTRFVHGVSVVNGKADPHWGLCVDFGGRLFLLNPLAQTAYDLQKYEVKDKACYRIFDNDFKFLCWFVNDDVALKELRFFVYERTLGLASEFYLLFRELHGCRTVLDEVFHFCWRFTEQKSSAPRAVIDDVPVCFIDYMTKFVNMSKNSANGTLRSLAKVVETDPNVDFEFAETFLGVSTAYHRAQFGQFKPIA